MKESKVLEIVYVKSPLVSHITLEYYRKFIKDSWHVLVSEREDEVISFLEEEQLNYQLIDNLNSWKDLKYISDCNLAFLTTDQHHESIQQLFEIAKFEDLKVDFSHLGGNEQLSLLPLKTVMERLRGPKGCAYDKKQTHESLKPNLIEEAYEVIDAIDQKSSGELCEELGDLLLQVIFHAQIAEERGAFQLGAVINSIQEKLIRRHPHVFGGEFASPHGNLSWEQIKGREKQRNKQGLNSEGDKNKVKAEEVRVDSVLDGIPKGASALVRAEQIQKCCRQVGFDWHDISGAVSKVEEELTELVNAYHENNWEKIEEELGDVLFSLVNLSRFLNISSEAILEKTNKKFISRFNYIESKLATPGLKNGKYSLEKLDKLWNEAKKLGF